MPRRRASSRRALPGSRAVVGGLLVALAALGTLVSWQRASGAPEGSVVVAERAIRPGEVVTADDVRAVPADLPAGVASAAFGDVDDVVGRVALGPVGDGELVQEAQVSDPGEAEPTAEVSFAVARDRAVDGRLTSGDLVDVFVSDDLGTRAVAERVRVVTVTDGGTTLTSSSELTVTLALTDPGWRADIVQAIRSGEVTLVRSTHLGPAPTTTRPTPPPVPPDEGGGPADPTAAPDAAGPADAAEPADTTDTAETSDGEPVDGGSSADSTGPDGEDG